MGQAYNIDLIDRHARKMHLGSITSSSVKCKGTKHAPVKVHGELRSTPEDKRIYLQTASTHGDTLKLSISNDTKTFLGNFRLSFFDPQSHEAIFSPIGNIEVIASRPN